MRRKISQENEHLGGMFISLGSIKHDEKETYPVAMSSEISEKIGEASDIKREEDGKITAEIKLFERDKVSLDAMESAITKGFYEYAAYCSDLEYDEDGFTIKSAKLRMVSLIPIPHFPKDVAMKEED